MNSGINLLTKKEDASVKEKKRIKILRIIAGSCLGITALVIVILIFLYSQLKISSIKRDQESAIKTMSYLHEKSAKLNAVSDRVSMIEQVFKKRKDFRETITQLIKQLPVSVKVSGIDISGEQVSMRLYSNSLYDFKIFINRMEVLAGQRKIIKDLTVESLTLDAKNGRYNLSLDSSIL
jgi:Tfp pilus assembly protein PilN